MGRTLPRPALACIALAALTLAPTASASDWPQFRGPSANSTTDEKGFPTKWGKDAGLAWKTALPKSSSPHASPIASGDRIFLTYASDQPVEHHVMCFAQADGKLLWDVKVDPGPWKLQDLRGGYNAPTPCADGERVYALFGSAVLVALDFKGQPVWRKELAKYNFDVALGTSPLLYQDTVILLCDRNKPDASLMAFDRKTGAVKWEEPRPKAAFSHCTPVLASVGGKPQLIIGGNGLMVGADPATGKTLWSCECDGETSSPAFGGGLVYVDSGRGGNGICVDATQGKVKWKTPTKIPESLCSPVAADGYLYRLMKGPALRCLKLDTGADVYDEKLRGASTCATPVITGDGLLYVVSGGVSHVVRTGQKFEIVGGGDLADPSNASPAFANGRIYVRGTAALYALGAK
jgi:outer membrane protein assembly factor BamB